MPSPAWAGDNEIITHANAPLGLGLDDAKRKFPRCSLTNLSDGQSNVSWALPPLTGYWPPFLDILPTFNDTILSSSREGMFSKIPLPNDLGPTLDGDVLQRWSVWCGDPNDSTAPTYEFLVFQSKIMVVMKDTVDRAAESADEAMALLGNSLTGLRGPTHEAASIRNATKVLVTYSDDGNERTIFETEDKDGRVPVFVWIAYVDLPLWHTYSTGVIQKLKALAAQQLNELQAIKKGL